jgi:putative alpha-1,2-mannosidase
MEKDAAMRTGMSRLALMALAMPGLLLAQTKPAAPLWQQVDPMVGTGNNNEGDTVPGPALPFGPIHPRPKRSSPAMPAMTRPSRSPALPSCTRRGWRRHHLWHLPALPQTGDVALDEAAHASPKQGEVAAADHYAVTLTRYATRWR